MLFVIQSFGLEDLSVLVLDEADRLLEMGFKEEVLSSCLVFLNACRSSLLVVTSCLFKACQEFIMLFFDI